MSPINSLDTEDIKIAPPRVRPASVAKPTSSVAEVSLPEETLRDGMPILRARIVYLGPGEHHAVSMTGQIHETYVEDPHGTVVRPNRAGEETHYTVLKKAATTGTTQYDFSIRDTRGELIPERMMPADSKYAGRPFAWCEHVGHVRKFFLARDGENGRGEKLYHVMTLQEHVHILQDHLRKSERARKANDQLFSEVTGR